MKTAIISMSLLWDKLFPGDQNKLHFLMVKGQKVKQMKNKKLIMITMVIIFRDRKPERK